MLKKFSVKNYRNFKETVEFDFSKVGGYKFNQDCISDNLIGKAILYGRNATGKTNLGEAFGDLFYLLSGSILKPSFDFINADSDELTITYYYEFQFGKDNIAYEYQKNQFDNLVREKLMLNNNIIFDIDIINSKFSSENLELIGADNNQFNNYQSLVGKIEFDNFSNSYFVPFLSYFLKGTPLQPDSIIKRMENYVLGMRFHSVFHQKINYNIINLSDFKDFLKKGNNLQDFQDFLNIMGIHCELCIQTLPDGKDELYFKHKRLISFFKNASSGTNSLVNIYFRFIVTLKNPSFIYWDEFDAFFHYEMSEKLVRYFKEKYPNCQIIMTTHNTNLMTNHLMRPDCLFIISQNGYITALCDATERELREGHNLEKMYIGGEFEQYE